MLKFCVAGFLGVGLLWAGEAGAQARDRDMVGRAAGVLRKAQGVAPIPLMAIRPPKNAGTIAYWNGHLVVVQSPESHDKMAELLKRMRDSRR
ncbi:MAG: hypothetical protein FJ272_13045 [Planctomycetes bacterium]|nr:hypothetical protein [Planctomycetota bacterium]MBM4085709.1 hypothetical protein [Planctomycetota bacterium]